MLWTFDIGWLLFFGLLAVMVLGCFLMKRRCRSGNGCPCPKKEDETDGKP